jgi:hypothetical protein
MPPAIISESGLKEAESAQAKGRKVIIEYNIRER